MHTKYAIAALLAGAALLFAMFSGCRSTPPTSSSTPPTGGGGGATSFSGPTAPTAARLTLLAVDYSQSTEHIRSQLLGGTFDIGTNFDSARDTLRLLRFGNDVQEMYSGLPEDDDAFALVLAKYAKGSDPVTGTDYPHLAEYLASTAASAPEKEVRIVVAGDGLNDFVNDPASEKRYRAAALRLSRNPRVVWVRFWGPAAGPREEIRSVFRPLGRRLQILSLDQNPLAP